MKMAIDFRTKLYKFVSKYIAEHECSPSFTEIIEALGISLRSKSLITRSLRILEKEGKVVLIKEGRRLHISLSSKNMPLLGRISAGSPIEALPHNQFLDTDNLLQGKNRFALQVRGNSMIDDGILDGDIIICQQAETAKEGEIVVVLIDQHNTTLKRISYKAEGMITLTPSNAELKPRAYSPERIHVQGIYIGLLRMNL